MIHLTSPSINKQATKNVLKVMKAKKFADGQFQTNAEEFIRKKIKSNFVALTQSCTDALEMASIILNLQKGDEVIMPSFTFTSTANAVVMRGAKPRFVDVCPKTLCVDPLEIEKQINKKTKAIYVVHYGGLCCDMDKILKLKKKHSLYIVEDAAHSFLTKYKNRYAGTIGDIGVFSFHETKNVVGGQGGAISVNNKSFIKRSNYLLDKGTNRRALIKNNKIKVIFENKKNIKTPNKFYSWVDIGSEYRASELTSALIFSQLKNSQNLQRKRGKLWNKYLNFFKKINQNTHKILKINKGVQSSYHLFILIMQNSSMAAKLRSFLQKKNIVSTFHYIPLHKSKFGKKFPAGSLVNTNNVWSKIVRLPFYPDLKEKDLKKIFRNLKYFFENKIYN